jgi:hypothetical protein
MIRKYSFYALLSLLSLVILSCLLTLMVIFMGGSFTGADLNGLLLVQTAAIPVTLLFVAAEIRGFVRLNGWRVGLALLWRKIPAWLVLALVLLNSLVFVGELSVLLIDYLMDEPLPWTDHVPLLSLLCSSLAFTVLYAKVAQLYWNGVTRLGRWP